MKQKSDWNIGAARSPTRLPMNVIAPFSSEAGYNPTTSKQVGMTHRETALVQIARFSSK